MVRLTRLCALVLLVAVFSGCSTVSYLFQATKGQMALWNHARPIEDVLKDEKVKPRIRALLSEIPRIKRFGEENGLKPTANYIEYVELNRPAAVYVVSACEALRFKAKEWSFPIVGSFPYLGWFDVEDAKSHAEKLRRNEGWDVDVRGAAAYSTLGWFRDAVLSSMISDGPEALGELVNVVLHESVHATLYINGQSYFDETIASFIADRLTPEYLRRYSGADSVALKAYLEGEKKGQEARARLHEAYGKLERLYSSEKTAEQKLAEKGKLLASLKDELKFKREINNATLIQYKTYHSGGAEFEALLKSCSGSWKRFLGALLMLNPKSFSVPQQENLVPVAEQLARSGCPAAH